MEIRHLRCFLALVEEQNFTRAAERLFIEQSPFSRNIKELEERLDSQLFERDRRKIRLTQAGEALIPYVRQLFTMLELGLARSNIRRKEIISTSIWEDTLVAVVPKGHPTLRYRRIPLDELLKYPMIGSDPSAYGGYHHQIDRLLRSGNVPPRITEWAKSMDMLLTLVSAGHGVAIASASRMGACRHHNIVVRPLAAKRPPLMTYLLQHESLNSAAATDFIERMHAHENYGYDEGEEDDDDEVEDRQNVDAIPLMQPSYGRESERLRV